jgi:hypothetical protein
LTSHNQLESEYEVYQNIGKLEGFLELLDYFTDSQAKYIAFTLVDKSLEEQFSLCERKFELKTTLMIGIKMVNNKTK